MRSEFCVLVVDDEKEIVRDLVDILGDEGYEAEGAASGAEAQTRLAEKTFDLVLSDLRMPPPDGIALLRWAREQGNPVPFILLTAHADADLARQAFAAGAFDYVTKPWNTFELLLRLRRVKERWQLQEKNQRLERYIGHLTDDDEVAAFDHLIGDSPAMQSLFDLSRRVASAEATVLIRGDSGTGKSVLARAIHNISPRREGPFVKVNCGAIPETLLESELFGHEKGAFTGAIKQKLGLFEVADGGTLFLDEIGDISLPVQVKLLEVIEDKSFHRVGGTTRIDCDIRLIAATHRNLEEAIEMEEFREDLFYRLNVFPLTLPPLRERKADIPRLVEHFLKQRGETEDQMEPRTMQSLIEHAFPGNIREMENLLERALILAGNEALSPDHFPTLQSGQVIENESLPSLPESGFSLEDQERKYILAALEQTDGNKSRAAELLGLTRRTLYSRMEKHGIPV